MKLGLGAILVVGLSVIAFSFANPETNQVEAQPVNTKGLERITLGAG